MAHQHTRSIFAATLVLLAVLPAAGDPPAVTISVDTSARREAISPFVYGQFIEHLGRCIYGGLWAEMLEDRKFYYPVTGEAPAWEMFKPGPTSWEGSGHAYELLVRSPWMILGEKSAVAMVSEGAYVGEQSPRIVLAEGASAGLMQERLGLEAERDYVGRIVLGGDASAAPIEVSLVWGGGPGDRETVRIETLSADFAKHALRFRAARATDNGRIEIVGRGTGAFTIGTVSLMPADNVLGWRADTLALLRQLDSPVYRWPGGNFVSGYDWKDGIGDPDRRPPRKNPAWKGVEHNDVGLHEFMDLCRLIDAAPYVAVNTGLGGPESAAELVEYANGSVETAMGRLRAQNGRSAPYGIELWAVGNEMYGDWQLGHMPLDKYIEKHRAVVEAMRRVDPTIKPVAVGAVGEWSKTMLSLAPEHMALISEHVYWQDKETVPAHVAQVVDGIRAIAEAHRSYRKEVPALQGKDVRIALDEWNYWYGPYEYGELGTRYFLQDGLGIAAGLHEMFRNSDLFGMANYAQTVNVIGAIKTTATAAEMEPTGQVLALYRHHFGTTPVRVAGAPAPLDVAAALTPDERVLTLAVINPSTETRALRWELAGNEATGQAQVFVITGDGPLAHNAPGVARGVTLHQESTEAFDTIEAPGLSVTLARLTLR